MKIIKRDGRAVDYNREKIQIAIEKANDEVRPEERANKEQIKEIIKYIENLGKKRMLVEDIQDIIEEKLMGIHKYELAKKYIVYRYTRALVRKQNTTDESILGLIKTTNKELMEEDPNRDAIIASSQRDLIAGEVSKDLTKRILLPEKITKAHEEGILHFHDMDYFLQPILNCCLVDIGDMLDNGTVMNGKLIETPESFQVACIVITQIIAIVASSQYGGQSIYIKHLGKYLRRSKEKFQKEIENKYKEKLSKKIIEELVEQRLKSELVAGVQTIQYQINTLMTMNGKVPFVTLFLNLEKDDPYLEENAMIIEEILKQRYQGMKNEEGVYVTPTFPKLVYVLDEDNCLKGGKYDYLTKLAIKCSSKRSYPDYISAKKMRENNEKNVFTSIGSKNFLIPWKDKNGNHEKGRFNQGVVSINLPQIGIIADGDEDKFWELFEERLELCKEALMCRHYALLGTLSDISPIHWKYGAIARLKQGEKIDKLLKNGYSTISLGYIGLYEVTKLMRGVSYTEPEGQDFAIKIMNKLKETILRWRKETNIGFSLYETSAENLWYRFAHIDKERFGVIKDITDKGYYTNSYHIDIRRKIDEFSKSSLESKLQNLCTAGMTLYIEMPNIEKDLKSMETVIKFIYDNIQYAELNNEADIFNIKFYNPK